MISVLFALACIPVDGSKLLARHFAEQVAGFAALAPETELGYAPAPGATRVVRPNEVESIARSHGLDVTITERLCFEWPMRPLERDLAMEAMKRSLPSDATLEVFDMSRFPIPEGEIEFPRSTLRSGLWRGFVRFGVSGRFEIWARVSVSIRQTRVVAIEPVKAGERIVASSLKVDEFVGEPDERFVTSTETAVGRISRVAVAPGSPLIARLLDWPSAVLKGDSVRLSTSIGAAQISAQAIAQASGKIGDVIPVKNTGSGRVVQARVANTGEVILLR